MAQTLKHKTVGDYHISTIQTDAGGAAPSGGWSPFSSSDYIGDTPWPYETMVFKTGSSTGLYHEPHSDKKEAVAGHSRICAMVRKGTIPLGQGVRGPFGVPSLTAQEWFDQQSGKD